jgi:Na+/H+ antiporter NhaD/arsenite permease-like protein
MLIVTSLILVICRTLGYAPRAFLIAAAICANSGALSTLASGLPNLMIGAAADLPYAHFLRVSAPYALVSLAIALVLLRRAFRAALPWRQSPRDAELLAQKVQEFDPWALVESRSMLVRSGLILVLTILGFAFAGRLGVGLDFVAMAGGTAALLFAGRSVDEAISKVNWTVILFFVGLFVMIGCVEATGALEWVAGRVLALSGGREGALIALMTVFSAASSAVVDNIPVAATLVPVVNSLAASGVTVAPLWWALVLGCNLGGNGTPIGSIASVIALHALHDETREHVSWVAFMKLGGAIMVIQLVGAVGYLLLLQTMGWLP